MKNKKISLGEKELKAEKKNSHIFSPPSLKLRRTSGWFNFFKITREKESKNYSGVYISLRNPVAIVAMLAILMAAFFVISQGSSAAPLGETINIGLNYGTFSGLGQRDFREVLFRIINVIFGFIGIVAILIILYAGFLWMTSLGDPNKILRAKQTILNVAIGMIIMFASYSIVIFLMNLFLGAAGPKKAAPPPPPPIGGCENCGALGGGIIETVFPLPGALDVPRDTFIFVTFKEVMQNDTICEDAGCLGGINDGAENVYISYRDPNDPKVVIQLKNADVNASTTNGRTFVFTPKKYLGDGVHHVKYTVRLGKNILKAVDTDPLVAGNDLAFPGVSGYFSWWFDVGTRLDLIPPYIEDVFPLSESDAQKDIYTPKPALFSTGSFTVSSLPVPFKAAVVEPIQLAGVPDANSSMVGSYLGDKKVNICITGVGGVSYNIFAVDHPAACNQPKKQLDCLNSSALYSTSIVLGCGLKIEFNNPPDGTGQYSVQVENEILADTLKIGNTTYTFVGASPKAKEILIGVDEVETAINIRSKINGFQEEPYDVKIDAGGVANEVKLKAAIAGIIGDSIHISASNSWSSKPDFNLSGGRNPDNSRTVSTNKIPDESRDVILKINFSEEMFPLKVSGIVKTNESNVKGVGNLIVGGADPDFNTIRVYADLNDNKTPDLNEVVAGEWKLSNQFKTVEFVSSLSCGICESDGSTPCNAAPDCAAVGGGQCSTIKNSCGDIKKCLPIDPTKDVTHYFVQVDSANIETCDPLVPDDCKDDVYKTCVAVGGANHCQNASGLNYPKATDPFDGVVDSARNSLDGNWKTNHADSGAQGPLSFFLDVPGTALYPDFTKGDSYQWEFNINSSVNLKPPKIDEITPNLNGTSSLLENPTAKFDRLMMSSTFLPDNSYKDGLCGCANNNDCFNAATGHPERNESCDLIFKVCRSEDNKENFCRYKTECLSGPAQECKNQHYVTLVDTLKNTGYGIDAGGVDDDSDGFKEKTQMALHHTLFTENQSYKVDIGSGLKDIYQNCYLPGSGPNCQADANNPYCCDQNPQATECLPKI